MRHKHEYCPCLLCNNMEQIEAGIIMCIIDDCFARKPIKEITNRKKEVDKMIDQLPLVDMNTTVGKQQLSERKHQCGNAEKHGALYFYSRLWKSWAEKYVGNSQAAHMGVMTIATHCKYCGLELGV